MREKILGSNIKIYDAETLAFETKYWYRKKLLHNRVKVSVRK